MASNRGKKGGTMKSPKTEFHDDDDDFLENLVVDTNPEEAKKPTTYSNLKLGGFITKAKDYKGRLEKRQARIATAKEQDDDDDDDDDKETEKEQLERETRELQSELRKTERAAEKARISRKKKKHDDSANAYKVEYSSNNHCVIGPDEEKKENVKNRTNQER